MMERRGTGFAPVALFALLAGAAAAPGQAPDRPAELPPLLPVPPTAKPNPTPPAAPPAGPRTVYDPGYLYLPERAPDVSSADAAPCGPPGRFWFTPSLELGWTRGAQLPALVRAGARMPGLTVPGPTLYGDGNLPTPFRAGFSLATGVWLDPEHVRGFDAGLYVLGKSTTQTAMFFGNSPTLIPIRDAAGQPAFFPLAGPDVGIGAYQAGLSTRFGSADVNYRRNLYCEGPWRLDGLVGYRFADLGEDFQIYGKRAGPDGTIIRFKDHAEATNLFHGGQIGLAAEHRFGSWYVALTKKLAFGETFMTTDLDGAFRLNGNVDPWGIYSRAAVSGRRERSAFAVMPVLSVTVGRRLWDHGRVFFGYTFQHLTAVTRATEVIDGMPVLTATGLGTQRDTGTSAFWAQSMNLGLEMRY